MADLIFFVHGTGVRDVSRSVDQIRKGVRQSLGWGPDSVVAIEWGRAVGPQQLDIEPALPHERTKGVAGQPTDAAEAAALWELLMADPSLELRVLAEGREQAAGGSGLGQALGGSAAVTLDQQLAGLELDEAATPALADLGADRIRGAREELRKDPALSQAADRIGDAGDPELVLAAARSMVARALLLLEADEGPEGPARLDATARDDAVLAVRTALAPTKAGFGGFLLKRVVSPMATRMAVRRRAAFMDPLSDFIRDVAFYIQHGEKVRDYIAQEIRARKGDGLRVVLGHSLGGIASVDLLADPAAMTGPDGLKVDRLITAGSQAPYLYLLDSLDSLSPRTPEKLPFSPWLNVYNVEDLLSFLAAPVFVNATGIQDEPVDAGVPFPESHSAYWGQPRFYELLGKTITG